MARQYATHAASSAAAAGLATSSRFCTCAVMGCCVTHERSQRRLPLTTCTSILRPIWAACARPVPVALRLDALARRAAAWTRLGGVRRRERDCKSHRNGTEIAKFSRGGSRPPEPPSRRIGGAAGAAPGLEIQDAHLLDAPDRSVSRIATSCAGVQQRNCMAHGHARIVSDQCGRAAGPPSAAARDRHSCTGQVHRRRARRPLGAGPVD